MSKIIHLGTGVGVAALVGVAEGSAVDVGVGVYISGTSMFTERQNGDMHTVTYRPVMSGKVIQLPRDLLYSHL